MWSNGWVMERIKLVKQVAARIAPLFFLGLAPVPEFNVTANCSPGHATKTVAQTVDHVDFGIKTNLSNWTEGWVTVKNEKNGQFVIAGYVQRDGSMADFNPGNHGFIRSVWPGGRGNTGQWAEGELVRIMWIEQNNPYSVSLRAGEYGFVKKPTLGPEIVKKEITTPKCAFLTR